MGRIPSFINHAGVLLGSPAVKEDEGEDEEERRESPPDSAVAPAAVSEVTALTVEGDAGCSLSISALVLKAAERAAGERVGCLRMGPCTDRNSKIPATLLRETQLNGRHV